MGRGWEAVFSLQCCVATKFIINVAAAANTLLRICTCTRHHSISSESGETRTEETTNCIIALGISETVIGAIFTLVYVCVCVRERGGERYNETLHRRIGQHAWLTVADISRSKIASHTRACKASDGVRAHSIHITVVRANSTLINVCKKKIKSLWICQLAF
jgi:hypothetical protein